MADLNELYRHKWLTYCIYIVYDGNLVLILLQMYLNTFIREL